MYNWFYFACLNLKRLTNKRTKSLQICSTLLLPFCFFIICKLLFQKKCPLAAAYNHLNWVGHLCSVITCKICKQLPIISNGMIYVRGIKRKKKPKQTKIFEFTIGFYIYEFLIKKCFCVVHDLCLILCHKSVQPKPARHFITKCFYKKIPVH